MSKIMGSGKIRASMATQQSIVINSFKTTSKLKSMRNIRVCRICLEQSDSKNPDATLIKPCRCSGSLQFVHEPCLLQWLNTMVSRRLALGQPLEDIHCEICKQKLEIQYRKKLGCREKNNLKNRIKVYWPQFLINIGFLLLLFGGFGVLVYFKMINQSQTQQQYVTFLTLFCVAAAFLSIAIGIWVVKLFKNFLLKTQVQVAKIQQKQTQILIRPQSKLKQQSQPPQAAPEPQAEPQAECQQVFSMNQVSLQFPNPSNDRNQLNDQPSESEHTIVRKKFKVVPLKPQYKNSSLDCFGDDYGFGQRPIPMC